MLIIVTGSIGAGKSTVCLKLVEWARRTGSACGGVLSRKREGGGIVVEDVRTGRQMDLAGPPSLYAGPSVGDYSFSPEGIAFGMKAIEEAMTLPLAVIDELGPLELSGRGFSNAIPLLSRPREGVQVVVIREELLNSFIAVFNREAVVLKTTEASRDTLPWQISRAFSRHALIPGDGPGPALPAAAASSPCVSPAVPSSAPSSSHASPDEYLHICPRALPSG